MFSAAEIAELGIQIEENGRDFYNTLFEQSPDAEAKGIFKYLAEAEEKHIKTFEQILRAAHKYEPREAYPQEYFAYMNAIAAKYVFTRRGKGAEIAGKIKTDKEAVDMGIGLEKESIVFYEGMKTGVEKKEQGLIDGLIKQERGHLNKLTELRKKL